MIDIVNKIIPNALTENTMRSLKADRLSPEDIDVFNSPTRIKILRFIQRVNSKGFDEGYHRAIEDMKSIKKVIP